MALLRLICFASVQPPFVVKCLYHVLIRWHNSQGFRSGHVNGVGPGVGLVGAGTVGLRVGLFVVGRLVGAFVGIFVGLLVVGCLVGKSVG
mmetsp:Transcript_10100/g.16538  ORF Transcript_10100/g.16538 Transcript_10100/m.16538 type:complete len:90 (-) Transcript_10100:295-564(-)